MRWSGQQLEAVLKRWKFYLIKEMFLSAQRILMEGRMIVFAKKFLDKISFKGWIVMKWTFFFFFRTALDWALFSNFQDIADLLAEYNATASPE